MKNKNEQDIFARKKVNEKSVKSKNKNDKIKAGLKELFPDLTEAAMQELFAFIRILSLPVEKAAVYSSPRTSNGVNHDLDNDAEEQKERAGIDIDDLISLYFRDANETSLLSEAEEISLATSILFQNWILFYTRTVNSLAIREHLPLHSKKRKMF